RIDFFVGDFFQHDLVLPMITKIINVRRLIVHFAENGAELYTAGIFYRHLVIGNSDTIWVVQPMFAEFKKVAILPTECGLDSHVKLIKIKIGWDNNPAPNARFGFQKRDL